MFLCFFESYRFKKRYSFIYENNLPAEKEVYIFLVLDLSPYCYRFSFLDSKPKLTNLDAFCELKLSLVQQELKKQLRKTNDPNVVEELKKQLSWIVSIILLIICNKSHVLIVYLCNAIKRDVLWSLMLKMEEKLE